MQIVFILTVGIERPSGRRYFNIARELVRQGCRVRILALHPDLAACPQRRFVADGVEVWYVGQMHARKASGVPERFGPLALLQVLVTATLGLLWGIICSPADVYHLGKPQPVNGMAALLGVVLLRRRRFYVDCDDDETVSNRFSGAWQRWIFAFWQWLLPRLAAGITVNTRFLEARMRRIGGLPVVYVPNGVNPAQLQPPPAPVLAALRTALNLDARPVVAYVGTLALHGHPVDLLLSAFAAVAARQPTAALLLIGGGEDLPLLRDQVCGSAWQDRVYFVGAVPYSAVAAYLALADLSVDPVRDDAVARARSPLKIVESLALGIPVVTGAVGDRAEVLGPAGRLVRPADPADLAAALANIIADPVRRTQMAANARLQAERYTWERLARRWKDVYA